MDGASASLWHFGCDQAELNDTLDTQTVLHACWGVQHLQTCPWNTTCEDSSVDRLQLVKGSKEKRLIFYICILKRADKIKKRQRINRNREERLWQTESSNVEMILNIFLVDKLRSCIIDERTAESWQKTSVYVRIKRIQI